MSKAPPAGDDGRLQLLRELVKGDCDGLRGTFAHASADFPALIQFVSRHKLGAFTYSVVRQCGGAGNLLTTRMITALKTAALMERNTNQRLVVMLEDLAGVLATAGVDVVFIKGPLFAHRFYGSVDARGLADLDVLVRTAADLDRVEAILLENGFTRAFRVLGGRRLTRWFAHHVTYTRDALSLDVHWALQRHPTFNIDYSRLFATAVAVPFAGRTYTATSSEYELVMQILGLISDLQVGKLVLRSLVDIHRIVQTLEPAVDWNEFFAMRHRERILRPSLSVVDVMFRVLDCRAQFPRLGAALEAKAANHAPALAPQTILESRPFALGQKLMALRLYEMPLPLSVSWWLTSLPFRMAAYASGRLPVRRS